MVVVDTHEAVTLADPGMGLEGTVEPQAIAVGVHVGEQQALWQGGKNKRGGGVILCTHTPTDTIQCIPNALE